MKTDKRLVVSFITTKITDASNWLKDKLMPYSTMYEIFPDEEESKYQKMTNSAPNQMVFESFELDEED